MDKSTNSNGPGDSSKMSDRLKDQQPIKPDVEGSVPSTGGGGDKAAKSGGDAASMAAQGASKATKSLDKTGAGASVDEVRKQTEEGGAMAGASAAAKEAGIQAASKSVVAATGGAMAPVQKQMEKGMRWASKEENRKYVFVIILTPIAISLIVGFIILATLADVFKNPASVLTDPKKREFAITAGKALGRAVLNLGRDDHSKQNIAGINSAIAADPPPKPGSMQDKLNKIDFEKIKFQFQKDDCLYSYTTKSIINSSGNAQNVIDKVYESRGQVVPEEQYNSAVYYCIISATPLFNLSGRTPESRDVNKFASVHLNFAEPYRSGDGTISNTINEAATLVQKPKQDIDKLVYDKTYKRITPNEQDVPQFTRNATLMAQGAGDYIKKVRDALAAGEDPYLVDSDFQFKGAAETDSAVKTLDGYCSFTTAYIDSENLRSMVQSRLNGSTRSGVKTLTLADTRLDYGVSPDEYKANYNLIQNWQNGRVYSQNVYGTQGGEAINPESVGNSAYNGNFPEIYENLFSTAQNCGQYQAGIAFGVSPLTLIQNIQGFIQSVTRIVSNYSSLQDIIIAGSNGKFTSKSDFGLQQIMVSLIRAGGASAVSGLEPGPQNFNNQSQGYRQLQNRYMIRFGGRFLTKEESTQLAYESEDIRRLKEKNQGIGYRLFDKNNIRSLVSIVQNESPKTTDEAVRVAKSGVENLSNPIRTIANTSNAISSLVLGTNNQAFAADALGDEYLKINTVGFGKELENINAITNSNELMAIKEIPDNNNPQKKMISRFDECIKQDIPSEVYFYKEPNYQDGVRVGDIGVDVFGLPVFIAMKDKTDYATPELGIAARNAAQARGGNGIEGAKPEKVQWIACDILLHDKTIYSAEQKQLLFGFSDIEPLAIKYRAYTFQNFLVDNLIKLSSNSPDDSIYANNPGSTGGGGSAECNTATGNEKIPCEGQKYIGLEYDFAHSNVRQGGAEKYRQRCTDDKLKPGTGCQLDCSSFVAAMLYDSFGSQTGFARDLALYVDVANGDLHTVNNPALSAQYFKEINFPDEVKPGDILTMPDHMAVVKSYDPNNGSVVTIESYGGSDGGPHEVHWNKINEEGFNRAFRYTGPGASN